MPYVEDIQPGTTRQLGQYTVTRDEILAFARDWDPQPFHTDEETEAFDGLIASGWHTTSIFMRLYVDAYLHDGAGRASPGVDELRWSTPVRPGDTLTASLTEERIMPSLSQRDRAIVAQDCELANQHGEAVLSMRLHTILLRRDADRPAAETA